PWEADQFAELQRRKAEQDAAEEALAAEATPTVAEAVTQAVKERAAAESGAPVDSGALPSEAVAAEGPVAEVMLAELAAEEPAVSQMWKWGTVAAIVLAVIGVVLVAWGIAAVAAAGKTSRVGYAGGGAISILGLLFVGAGAWVVFGNLRKRGVI
ncbi:MAG: hypothetical protein HY876_01605, partial [Coriobacteriales bacterium]|nr:hypothetical protein [Coriobacteriales bacterium]